MPKKLNNVKLDSFLHTSTKLDGINLFVAIRSKQLVFHRLTYPESVEDEGS